MLNYIIIGLAILFDIFGLIPWIGIIANPIFSFILFMVYGSKKKNFGMKLVGSTGVGVIIESIPGINLIPTNTLNAILAIYVFK